VIIVRENHSFDNYFGTFPGANGLQKAPPSVHPFHVQGRIIDLCHDWSCAHAAYDTGKMDNFQSAESSTQTFGCYDQRDIPYYWALAKNYTLFDNYFTSVMSLSLPNYVYLLAAQSGGLVDNTHVAFHFKPIMEELDSSHVSLDLLRGLWGCVHRLESSAWIPAVHGARLVEQHPAERLVSNRPRREPRTGYVDNADERRNERAPAVQPGRRRSLGGVRHQIDSGQ